MSKRRAAITDSGAYRKGGTFKTKRRRLPAHRDPALLGQEISITPVTKQELAEHQARELAVVTQQRDAALRVLTNQANFALLVSNVDKAAVQLEELLKRFQRLITGLAAFG